MWQMDDDAYEKFLRDMASQSYCMSGSLSMVPHNWIITFHPVITADDITTLDALIDIVLDMKRPDFFAQLTDLRKRLNYYLAENVEG